MHPVLKIADSRGQLFGTSDAKQRRASVRALPGTLLFVLLGSSLLCAGGRPASSTGDVDGTLELFEARYRSAKALSTIFLEQFIDNGKPVRREAGRAYFLHPGKMRWDYESPEKNTFLVDGKYVWFYSPADHTATRMPTKKSEDWRTPLAFLTSDMKLSRVCARIEPDSNASPSEPGDLVFRCALRASKGDASSNAPVRLQRQHQDPPVVFEVSPEGELRRIVVAQEGRVQLEFSFRNWLWNPSLPKDWFEFVPAKGVAIVDGQLSDASGLRQ